MAKITDNLAILFHKNILNIFVSILPKTEYIWDEKVFFPHPHPTHWNGKTRNSHSFSKSVHQKLLMFIADRLYRSHPPTWLTYSFISKNVLFPLYTNKYRESIQKYIFCQIWPYFLKYGHICVCCARIWSYLSKYGGNMVPYYPHIQKPNMSHILAKYGGNMHPHPVTGCVPY